MNKFFPLAGIALAGMISSADAGSKNTPSKEAKPVAHVEQSEAWGRNFASRTCEGAQARLRLVLNIQRLVIQAISAREHWTPFTFNGKEMDPDYFLYERPTSMPKYAFSGTQAQELHKNETVTYVRRSVVGAVNALSAAAEDALIFQRDALEYKQERQKNGLPANMPQQERARLEGLADACVVDAISETMAEDGTGFVEPQVIEGALGKIASILDTLYKEEYNRALAKEQAEARRKAAAKAEAAKKKPTTQWSSDESKGAPGEPAADRPIPSPQQEVTE